MLEVHSTSEDTATTLSQGGSQFIPWRLVELRALPDYRLFQRFADGTEGYVEMRELIFSEHAGVFVSLRDPEVFSQVTIDPDFGSVSWANGLDIAPDASHEDIRCYGVQILR
jgi:hypothetical protein